MWGTQGSWKKSITFDLWMRDSCEGCVPGCSTCTHSNTHLPIWVRTPHHRVLFRPANWCRPGRTWRDCDSYEIAALHAKNAHLIFDWCAVFPLPSRRYTKQTHKGTHTEMIFCIITHNYSPLICRVGSKGQATLKYTSAVQQHWFTCTEALVVGDICKIYDNSTPHITL